MKTLQLKKYEYLDLIISDKQLNKFGFINTNSRFKLLILNSFEITILNYKQKSNIQNYQCKLLHINKSLKSFRLDFNELQIYFNQFPRTTDCLYNLDNKDKLAKILFDSFKCLNEIKINNNPNSLYNLSMKRVVDNYFSFDINSQYYLPINIYNKIQSNINQNIKLMNLLNIYPDEISNHFSFCDILFKKYNEYF